MSLFEYFDSGSKLKEECGIMGVAGSIDAARLIYLGLYALQHRGQEACGIVTFEQAAEGTKLHVHKSFGLVVDGIGAEQIRNLHGHRGIGHVRYSTQGGRLLENIQPFQFKTALGPIAIAHNGNLTNAKEIRKKFESEGSIFQSTSDTEVFIHLILRSKKEKFIDKLRESMEQVSGAYSLLVLTKEHLYALRDSFGFRPLVIGKKDKALFFASETCAFDLIDANFVREVNPGEIVCVTSDGEEMTSFASSAEKKLDARRFCSFEQIYFSRPDSLFDGKSVYEQRKELGKLLARECPATADVLIPVPDSGVPQALGFSEESGIPFELGLVRNHYVGRTFIQPTQEIRDFGVKLKLNPVEKILRGKRVVVVDDSLVRGTTSAKIIRMIRESGAKEVHFRIASPPVTHSCFYGIDTPERSKLLAAQNPVDEIRKFVGADSIGFLSVEGLKKSLRSEFGHCFACFTGNYAEDIHRTIEPQPTDKNGPGLKA